MFKFGFTKRRSVIKNIENMSDLSYLFYGERGNRAICVLFRRMLRSKTTAQTKRENKTDTRIKVNQ